MGSHPFVEQCVVLSTVIIQAICNPQSVILSNLCSCIYIVKHMALEHTCKMPKLHGILLQHTHQIPPYTCTHTHIFIEHTHVCAHMYNVILYLKRPEWLGTDMTRLS